jgi:aminomethyltransferase
MGRKTPLYQAHVEAGARMVDFGGWDMPLHYGSQLKEHQAVRSAAGMFDVSHMRPIDLTGGGVRGFLSQLLANNVARLKGPGKALYTCMLNEQGGVIDDLIAYALEGDRYRLVVNAATADGDLKWIEDRAKRFTGVRIFPRTDLAMIAVQGPRARELAARAVSSVDGFAAPPRLMELESFSAAWTDTLFVARTGYTGEDGFEIAMGAERAPAAWRALSDAGAVPCGLGARDTLRLEAGMNLYGADMDQTTTPLESGLAWTVGWDPPDRQFVGRAALEKQRGEGVPRKLVGLVLLGRGVLRGHQKVTCGEHGYGEITSGSFSPTLSSSIALARVPSGVDIGDECSVSVRGKGLAARVVAYPFVRHGKSLL